MSEKQEAERAAKEADKKHRDKIDAEAIESLSALSDWLEYDDPALFYNIIKAIAAGEVKHVTINY